MGWTQAWMVGIVVIGAQWPVIDLPYPEVPEGGGAPVAAWPVEQQVEAAICHHVHSRYPVARGIDISQLRVDGARATALVTSGPRVEWIHLEQVRGEWRVVQTFAHR
jgi:hypothetical protein